MKKVFETPNIKVSTFDKTNIIVASGGEAKNNFSYSNDEYTVHINWDDMTIIL